MFKKITLIFCCLFLIYPNLSLATVQNKQIEDWGIKYINVKQLWTKGYTGKGIKVGVIDTGVDYTHPDLKGAIAGGVSVVSYTKSYYDDNGHGTHVSGIIAAQNNYIGSVGVAYGAKIYAVKAMNQDGEGTVPDIIKGINWCISNKMNIINLSLGLTDDELNKPSFKQLESVINNAYSKGIFIVAASGNDGVNKVNYPANFKNVIAVGAVCEYYNSKTKKSYPMWADFSNYSSKVEVVAPGVFVYSTYPMKLTPFWNSYRGYEFDTGTSMASPYVAGFLAVLKQKYPRDSMAALRNRLHQNTVHIGDKNKTGYGLIKAR